MFCRLCAQDQTHTVPIFSDTSLKIDKILYRLLSIKVYRNDVLPTAICLDCFRTTNVLNEFKTTVKQAQEILKLLNITQPEIEMAKFEEMEAVELGSKESNLIEEFDYEMVNFEEIEAVEPVCEERNSVDPAIEEYDYEIIADTEIAYTSEVELEVLTQDEGDDKPDSKPNKQSNEKVPRLRRDEFKNLLCTDCDEISQSPLLLTKHFEIKHHKQVQFKCSYCSQIYQKYRSFNRHVMTHLESNRFVCEICGRSFAQKCGLKNHLHSHVNGRTFECDKCHLKFKQFSTLYNHRKVHTHAYSCDECKKSFSTSLTLSQHKKAKHFNQKDKFCNKGYSSSSGLYYHELSHLEQKYFCLICARKFNTKSLLKRHMNMHKDPGAEYTCQLCGKSFKSQNSLILHKKIHDEDVNFQMS